MADWDSEAASKFRARFGKRDTDEVGDASKWRLDYKGRELDFCRDVLGMKHPVSGKLTMWKFARKLVQSVIVNPRTVVTSSRSTSKTHTLGRLAAAWLWCEPSRVLIIAPSMRQAEKGVMGEMQAAIAAAAQPLKFEAKNSKEVRIDERHWAMCLPSRDPDAMRGFHGSPEVPSDPDEDFLSEEDLKWLEEQGNSTATRLLVIIDEAPGVSGEAIRVLSGMMTKPGVHFVLTGNATLGADDTHQFVEACRPGSGWHRMRVSSIDPEEYPAAPGIEYDEVFYPVPQWLVQESDVERALATQDRTDPFLWSDWAGTFSPGSADYSVVPRSALIAALEHLESPTRKRLALGPRMGVDIGAGSPDPCAFSLFFNGVKVADHRWAPSREDVEGQCSVADMIRALGAKWGKELGERYPDEWDGSPIRDSRISIDDSGMVGVGDILARAGWYVDRVNFAKKAEGQWRELVGTQRFANIRTEMHWVARRGLQEGVFVIPESFRNSWSEATWTRFERDYDGIGPIIKLEKKDEVRKRQLGKSPDTFDADILAMRQSRQPSDMQGQAGAPIQGPDSRDSQPVRGGRKRPTRLSGAFEL